jgi:hypothetical protein
LWFNSGSNKQNNADGRVSLCRDESNFGRRRRLLQAPDEHERKPIPSDPRTLAKTCEACLILLDSSWCPSTSQCLNATGAATNTSCAVPVLDDTCKEEAVIKISSPTSNDTVYAGQTYDIKWAGGPSSEEVFIAFTALDLNDDEAFSVSDWSTGAGLPFVAVPNTGTYSWSVEGGMPSSDKFRVVVASSSTATNFDVSDGFHLVGELVHKFEWWAPVWGERDVCPGELQHRKPECRASEGAGFEKMNIGKCDREPLFIDSKAECEVTCDNDDHKLFHAVLSRGVVHV